MISPRRSARLRLSKESGSNARHNERISSRGSRHGEVSPDGVRVNVLTPGAMPEAAIYQSAMPGIAKELGIDVVVESTGTLAPQEVRVIRTVSRLRLRRHDTHRAN